MNFSMNESATFFDTKNLFDAIQDWPQLLNRPLTAPFAALSTFASSSTMNGSEPPSSRTHFLSCDVARWPTIAPIFVLPVNVTALTGESIRLFAASELPIIVENVPFGNPDSSNARSSSSPDCMVTLDGFITITFPAIRHGAANLRACQYGKFHGMIDATTPSGSNVIKLFRASVFSTSSEMNVPP